MTQVVVEWISVGQEYSEVAQCQLQFACTSPRKRSQLIKRPSMHDGSVTTDAINEAWRMGWDKFRTRRGVLTKFLRDWVSPFQRKMEKEDGMGDCMQALD